jgi:hypothetical protein
MVHDRGNQVADKQELLEVVHRYCRAIDRRDFALLRTVYHPDGIDDHGGMFSGGLEDFIAMAQEQLAKFSATTHMVMNSLFKIDGEFAEGETSVLACHVSPEKPNEPLIVAGRYLDRFARRHGEWRILHRSTVGDWANFPGGMDPNGPKGQTNRSDLSYQFLSMFQGG